MGGFRSSKTLAFIAAGAVLTYQTAGTHAASEHQHFRQRNLQSTPEGALEDDIVKIIKVEGDNPRSGWSDSYSVGDKCYMDTTFDHGIGEVEVDTPIGNMTIKDLYDQLEEGPGSDGHPLYNDIQCGNGPANTAGDETTCPGLVKHKRDGCGQIGPKWDLSELDE